MKKFGDIDSKFRYVIIASKRAKQLLRGGKPKLKSKSKNPIRVAQLEVTEGLVEYEIIELKEEKVRRPGEEGFIGEEISNEGEGKEEEAKGKAKGKAKVKAKVKKSEDEPKKITKGKPKKKGKTKKI